MVNTTLSRNGYKIKKCELSQKELKTLKTDLTVNPYVVGDLAMVQKSGFHYIWNHLTHYISQDFMLLRNMVYPINLKWMKE